MATSQLVDWANVAYGVLPPLDGFQTTDDRGPGALEAPILKRFAKDADPPLESILQLSNFTPLPSGFPFPAETFPFATKDSENSWTYRYVCAIESSAATRREQLEALYIDFSQIALRCAVAIVRKTALCDLNAQGTSIVSAGYSSAAPIGSHVPRNASREVHGHSDRFEADASFASAPRPSIVAMEGIEFEIVNNSQRISLLGSHENALRLAQHRWIGHSLISDNLPFPFVSPLCCLVEYSGYRVWCYSSPPLKPTSKAAVLANTALRSAVGTESSTTNQESTAQQVEVGEMAWSNYLVHGSSHCGGLKNSDIFSQLDPEATAATAELASVLNLRGHYVGSGTNRAFTFVNGDFAVYRGRDNRLWVSPRAGERLIPPVTTHHALHHNGYLYRRFRPELVRKSRKSATQLMPLSSDCFAPFATARSTELDRDAALLTELLKTRLMQDAADALVDHCVSSESVADVFSMISGVGGLSTFFHRRGVNVRQLGAMTTYLSEKFYRLKASPFGNSKENKFLVVRLACLVVVLRTEMITRSLKQLVRRMMRGRQWNELIFWIAATLREVRRSSSWTETASAATDNADVMDYNSATFFEDHMWPVISHKFGLGEEVPLAPFTPSSLSIHSALPIECKKINSAYVIEQVAAATGLTFTLSPWAVLTPTGNDPAINGKPTRGTSLWTIEIDEKAMNLLEHSAQNAQSSRTSNSLDPVKRLHLTIVPPDVAAHAIECFLEKFRDDALTKNILMWPVLIGEPFPLLAPMIIPRSHFGAVSEATHFQAVARSFVIALQQASDVGFLRSGSTLVAEEPGKAALPNATTQIPPPQASIVDSKLLGDWCAHYCVVSGFNSDSNVSNWIRSRNMRDSSNSFRRVERYFLLLLTQGVPQRVALLGQISRGRSLPQSPSKWVASTTSQPTDSATSLQAAQPFTLIFPNRRTFEPVELRVDSSAVQATTGRLQSGQIIRLTKGSSAGKVVLIVGVQPPTQMVWVMEMTKLENENDADARRGHSNHWVIAKDDSGSPKISVMSLAGRNEEEFYRVNGPELVLAPDVVVDLPVPSHDWLLQASARRQQPVEPRKLLVEQPDAISSVSDTTTAQEMDSKTLLSQTVELLRRVGLGDLCVVLGLIAADDEAKQSAFTRIQQASDNRLPSLVRGDASTSFDQSNPDVHIFPYYGPGTTLLQYCSAAHCLTSFRKDLVPGVRVLLASGHTARILGVPVITSTVSQSGSSGQEGIGPQRLRIVPLLFACEERSDGIVRPLNEEDIQRLRPLHTLPILAYDDGRLKIRPNFVLKDQASGFAQPSSYLGLRRRGSVAKLTTVSTGLGVSDDALGSPIFVSRVAASMMSRFGFLSGHKLLIDKGQFVGRIFVVLGIFEDRLLVFDTRSKELWHLTARTKREMVTEMRPIYIGFVMNVATLVGMNDEDNTNVKAANSGASQPEICSSVHKYLTADGSWVQLDIRAAGMSHYTVVHGSRIQVVLGPFVGQHATVVGVAMGMLWCDVDQVSKGYNERFPVPPSRVESDNVSRESQPMIVTPLDEGDFLLLPECLKERTPLAHGQKAFQHLIAPGYVVDMDHRDESCGVFGLFHGQRIHLAKDLVEAWKQCTVLGVYRNELWVLPDGDMRAVVLDGQSAADLARNYSVCEPFGTTSAVFPFFDGLQIAGTTVVPCSSENDDDKRSMHLQYFTYALEPIGLDVRPHTFVQFAKKEDLFQLATLRSGMVVAVPGGMHRQVALPGQSDTGKKKGLHPSSDWRTSRLEYVILGWYRNVLYVEELTTTLDETTCNEAESGKVALRRGHHVPGSGAIPLVNVIGSLGSGAPHVVAVVDLKSVSWEELVALRSERHSSRVGQDVLPKEPTQVATGEAPSGASEGTRAHLTQFPPSHLVKLSLEQQQQLSTLAPFVPASVVVEVTMSIHQRIPRCSRRSVLHWMLSWFDCRLEFSESLDEGLQKLATICFFFAGSKAVQHNDDRMTNRSSSAKPPSDGDNGALLGDALMWRLLVPFPSTDDYLAWRTSRETNLAVAFGLSADKFEDVKREARSHVLLADKVASETLAQVSQAMGQKQSSGRTTLPKLVPSVTHTGQLGDQHHTAATSSSFDELKKEYCYPPGTNAEPENKEALEPSTSTVNAPTSSFVVAAALRNAIRRQRIKKSMANFSGRSNDTQLSLSKTTSEGISSSFARINRQQSHAQGPAATSGAAPTGKSKRMSVFQLFRQAHATVRSTVMSAVDLLRSRLTEDTFHHLGKAKSRHSATDDSPRMTGGEPITTTYSTVTGSVLHLVSNAATVARFGARRGDVYRYIDGDLSNTYTVILGVNVADGLLWRYEESLRGSNVSVERAWPFAARDARELFTTHAIELIKDLTPSELASLNEAGERRKGGGSGPQRASTTLGLVTPRSSDPFWMPMYSHPGAQLQSFDIRPESLSVYGVLHGRRYLCLNPPDILPVATRGVRPFAGGVQLDDMGDAGDGSTQPLHRLGQASPSRSVQPPRCLILTAIGTDGDNVFFATDFSGAFTHHASQPIKELGLVPLYDGTVQSVGRGGRFAVEKLASCIVDASSGSQLGSTKMSIISAASRSSPSAMLGNAKSRLRTTGRGSVRHKGGQLSTAAAAQGGSSPTPLALESDVVGIAAGVALCDVSATALSRIPVFPGNSFFHPDTSQVLKQHALDAVALLRDGNADHSRTGICPGSLIYTSLIPAFLTQSGTPHASGSFSSASPSSPTMRAQSSSSSFQAASSSFLGHCALLEEMVARVVYKDEGTVLLRAMQLKQQRDDAESTSVEPASTTDLSPECSLVTSASRSGGLTKWSAMTPEAETTAALLALTNALKQRCAAELYQLSLVVGIRGGVVWAVPLRRVLHLSSFDDDVAARPLVDPISARRGDPHAGHLVGDGTSLSPFCTFDSPVKLLTTAIEAFLLCETKLAESASDGRPQSDASCGWPRPSDVATWFRSTSTLTSLPPGAARRRSVVAAGSYPTSSISAGEEGMDPRVMQDTLKHCVMPHAALSLNPALSRGVTRELSAFIASELWPCERQAGLVYAVVRFVAGKVLKRQWKRWTEMSGVVPQGSVDEAFIDRESSLASSLDSWRRASGLKQSGHGVVPASVGSDGSGGGIPAAASSSEDSVVQVRYPAQLHYRTTLLQVGLFDTSPSSLGPFGVSVGDLIEYATTSGDESLARGKRKDERDAALRGRGTQHSHRAILATTRRLAVILGVRNDSLWKIHLLDPAPSPSSTDAPPQSRIMMLEDYQDNEEQAHMRRFFDRPENLQQRDSSYASILLDTRASVFPNASNFESLVQLYHVRVLQRGVPIFEYIG